MIASSVQPVVDALRVGEWTLDVALNELRRGGQCVRLEPKAGELLCFLAGRAGQVVGREELFAALWPGVVVTDDTLTQAVLKLRRSLGDDARSPQYIETISKRGYRLIAPVAGIRPSVRPRVRAWPLAAGICALAVAASGLFLLGSSDDVPVAEDAGSAALPTVSVAPFEPIDADPAQRQLARGLAADLSTDLAKLAGLRVISFSSAEPAQLRQRGVRYVVTGTVQQTGGQLKVNARLVDTRDGRQVWSERYERPLSDIFAVQDDLTRRLASALPVKVTEAEKRRLAHRYTRSLAAYDSFLQAKAALMTRQQADNEKARALYRKAISHDPSFARAYAGLALTHAAEYRNQWASHGSDALSRALELAQTAMKIDPDVPEVHWALSYIHMLRSEHALALAQAKRAIALDRSYADAYALIGGIYSYIGEPARAVDWLRAGLRLNPDGGYLYYLLLGRAYLFLGDMELALVNLREALGRNAQDIECQAYLAATLALAGRHDEASWQAEEIRALRTGFSARAWLDTQPMTHSGQRTQLISTLEALGL